MSLRGWLTDHVTFDELTARTALERLLIGVIVLNGVGIATLFSAAMQLEDPDVGFRMFYQAMVNMTLGMMWTGAAMIPVTALIFTRSLRGVLVAASFLMVFAGFYQFIQGIMTVPDGYLSSNGFDGDRCDGRLAPELPLAKKRCNWADVVTN